MPERRNQSPARETSGSKCQFNIGESQAQRCGAVRYARASSDPRVSRSTTAAAPAVWRPACIYWNEKRNFSATRLDKIGIRISVRLTNGSDLSSQHEYFFAHHDLRRGVHPRLCGVVLCHAERL